MSGATRMVASLSLGLSIVRVAMMPGIEKYTLGLLADLFTENRFRVELIPNPHPMFSNVGNFFAYNLDK